MDRKKGGRSPKGTWAYAYELVPQDEERLRSIKAVLARENASAQRGARTWAGRVIQKQQVTHILVVSDGPEQDREINRRLEAELRALNVGFTVTAPMTVSDDAPLLSAPEPDVA